MKSLLSYIGDGAGGQALGVLGELKSMVNDCFIGVFEDDDKKGHFFHAKSSKRERWESRFH